jgi:lysozyme
MKTSNAGKVEIIGHEGIGLSKYIDSVGVWTIGAGLTRTEIPDLATWSLSKTITIQESFDLFEKALVPYEDALNAAISKPIKQTQFDALVSWCYNVGTGWVKKASVIVHINEGAPSGQLYLDLMKFNVPAEIKERRTKEANLLAYGKYSNDGRALLFPVSSRGYPLYKLGKSINVWEYVSNSNSDSPTITSVDKRIEKHFEVKPNLFKSLLNWFTGTNKKGL